MMNMLTNLEGWFIGIILEKVYMRKRIGSNKGGLQQIKEDYFKKSYIKFPEYMI